MIYHSKKGLDDTYHELDETVLLNIRVCFSLNNTCIKSISTI